MKLFSSPDPQNPEIISLGLSRSGRTLVTCDNTKRLSCYTADADNWTLRGSVEVPRRASCFAFSSDDKCLIVGEKSGNVYRLPLSDIPCTDQLSLILGHLSVLTDMAISDDGKLIATCDRDEKIRISRFSQPFVIECFCLGHHSFVSQLAFLPDSSLLISSGGDSYLRVWQSETGSELSSCLLAFPDCPNVPFGDPPSTDTPPVIISRLFVTKNNICICSSASHAVVFAIQIQVSDNVNVQWGSISKVITPDNTPLMDCAVSEPATSTPDVTVIGLITKAPARVVTWSLSYCPSESDPSSTKWSEMRTLNLPSELLSDLPNPSPRLELLKGLFKADNDRAMLEAYEENKSVHHQNILDRRSRHQQGRRLNKRLTESVSS
ncbi:unnamed protein product [Calicophoron daubneyi]|uniref:tRNA (guanine-N(7)-)-methyltransferase non-catalytic subunit n=1 Tax=Calicophoron daubneyi TaxID=300641 RepID=A0AAV2TDK5_CALDB